MKTKGRPFGKMKTFFENKSQSTKNINRAGHLCYILALLMFLVSCPRYEIALNTNCIQVPADDQNVDHSV